MCWDHITKIISVGSICRQKQELLTVCGHNGCAPRQTVDSVNQDDTAVPECVVDELTGMRKPDEEIGMFDILHRNTKVSDPGLWMLETYTSIFGFKHRKVKKIEVPRQE